MQSIGYYFGVPLQAEVLVLIVLGICFTIFDSSLLDLNTNMQQIWWMGLDNKKFTPDTQQLIKYSLSGILLLRSFSVHLHLAFYIVMLWPAIFEEKPKLLLPWLIVGFIKYLVLGMLTTCIGLYTCFVYGFRPICIDFVFSQIIDNSPSWYVWFAILCYYKELVHNGPLDEPCESIELQQTKADLESQLALRRRRARSMTEKQLIDMKLDDGRNLISTSTIETLLRQLSAQVDRTSRSLDTMLDVMAAQAEKDEILNVCKDIHAVDENVSIQDRTAKLLKVTAVEIEQAKKSRDERNNIMFSIESMDLLRRMCNGTTDNRPKVAARLSDYFPQIRRKLEEISPESSEEELSVITVDMSTHSLQDHTAEVGNKTCASQTTPLSVYKTSSTSIVKKRKDEGLVKDADCQASALGASVLTSTEDFVAAVSEKRNETVVSPRRGSPRTPMTPPSKSVTFTGAGPREMEGLRVRSNTSTPFKEDGYTAAYRRSAK